MTDQDNRKPGDSDMHRRQRGKNIALLAVMIGLCAIFYATTILRMGGGE